MLTDLSWHDVCLILTNTPLVQTYTLLLSLCQTNFPLSACVVPVQCSNLGTRATHVGEIS